MKYAISLVLVLSAAFAAMRETPEAGSLARVSNREAAVAYGISPWLTDAWQGVTDAADADPHAGLMAEGDPHAGLDLGANPGAATCPRSDDGEDYAADSDAADSDAAESDATYGAPSDVHAGLHSDIRAGASPHGQTRGPEVAAGVVTRSQASNGFTVAEIFAQRAARQGQRVALRATVVRRVDGVMGKTFLHLQDGSGGLERADYDLTATTRQDFEVGETVELEGELSIDQELGVGYVYPALLEEVQRVELH